MKHVFIKIKNTTTITVAAQRNNNEKKEFDTHIKHKKVF